jgi:hypothetical protein
LCADRGRSPTFRCGDTCNTDPALRSEPISTVHALGKISSNLREALEVGAEDLAMRGDVHEFPVAHRLDETSRLQLLDAVLKGGGGDAVNAVQGAARHGLRLRADLFQQLVPSRLGQRASDVRELGVDEAGLGAGVGCHTLRIACGRWEGQRYVFRVEAMGSNEISAALDNNCNDEHNRAVKNRWRSLSDEVTRTR